MKMKKIFIKINQKKFKFQNFQKKKKFKKHNSKHQPANPMFHWQFVDLTI